MRKPLLAAFAAALALTVGVVAVNATGVVTQNLKPNISPSTSGTAKKPKPVKLSLHLYATTSDGSVPPASKRVIVWFPRGMTLQASKFKSCSATVINDPNQGATKCPSGSKVGGGNATARIGSNPDSPTGTFTVTVINGPKGKTVFLYLQGSSQNVHSITGTITAKLVPVRTGPYSTKFDTTIPQNLYEPAPNVFTPLTDFSISIKATTRVKGIQYGYVATTSCPKKTHKWPFKATWNYANSPGQDNASAVVKCS